MKRQIEQATLVVHLFAASCVKSLAVSAASAKPGTATSQAEKGSPVLTWRVSPGPCESERHSDRYVIGSAGTTRSLALVAGTTATNLHGVEGQREGLCVEHHPRRCLRPVLWPRVRHVPNCPAKSVGTDQHLFSLLRRCHASHSPIG